MFKLLHTLLTENAAKDWFNALLATAAFMLVLLLLRYVTLRHFKRIVQSTHQPLTNFLVEILAATRILLVSATSLKSRDQSTL